MGPRILIVNVNWLGDVLFSTPAIRAVRKKFPESFIACLVPLRCESILKNNPYLDEVIVVEDKMPFYSLWKYLRIVSELKKRRFDTAIFFHRSKTKVLWARMAGIRERAGYEGPGRRWLLTRPCPSPEKALHKTDYFLRLLEFLDVPPDGRTPDFIVPRESQSEFEALLKNHGIPTGAPYAVMHAGGNWELKRWPASYFVEWAKLFLKKFPWKIILCGTFSEEALSIKITSNFKNGEVVSFCGKTSVDTLALLLRNAQIFLSNDSGPIHLAASQGTKIIGLFGPTSPDLTGPIPRGPASVLRKDVGCETPCYYRSCDYHVCMEWLKPEEVFEETTKLLK